MKRSDQLIYDKLPNPVTKTEERELIRLAQSGDLVARNKLVKANIRFVMNVVKTYKNYWSKVPPGDLVNDGAMGLIKAVYKFDLNKDLKFITYAVWWIRAYIEKCLYSNETTVMVGQNIKRNFKKAQKKAYEDGTEITAKMQEIKSLSELVELDDVENDFSGVCLTDGVFTQESTLNHSQLKNVINEMLKDLHYQDRLIVIKYFGLNKNDRPHTLREIGDLLPISHERIRQLKDEAVIKLKKIAKEKGYFKDLKLNLFSSSSNDVAMSVKVLDAA